MDKLFDHKGAKRTQIHQKGWDGQTNAATCYLLDSLKLLER